MVCKKTMGIYSGRSVQFFRTIFGDKEAVFKTKPNKRSEEERYVDAEHPFSCILPGNEAFKDCLIDFTVHRFPGFTLQE